ncbi:uncharacterized protein TNCV_1627011 [Trichonephila clavipes]|nr:uncharacterized protein TNCV_1627011 [Trichonephila clavipes]
MSSSPVPLKTRRVGQRCTLNLSRAEMSSRWCDSYERWYQLTCRPCHLTMIQNYPVRRQSPRRILESSSERVVKIWGRGPAVVLIALPMLKIPKSPITLMLLLSRALIKNLIHHDCLVILIQHEVTIPELVPNSANLHITPLLIFGWGCGSPVVKVSDHGRHVMSSSPRPQKTCRVGQPCTLNLSRAETSSLWCGVVVRRAAQVLSTSLDHGSK